MMPRHERRRLVEIERRLAAEDPEFARNLAKARPLRRALGCGLPRTMLTLGAATSAALCLALGDAPATLAASAVATALIMTRNWHLDAG